MTLKYLPFKIKNKFHKIFKIIQWAKFVWEEDDYDFDYVYLLKVMKHKLKMMEPVIRDGYAENSEETANEILQTIVYLDLLIEDNFSHNWEKLTEKYGDFNITNNEFLREGINKDNEEQYHLDAREAHNLDNLYKEQIKKALFKKLAGYESWWD